MKVILVGLPAATQFDGTAPTLAEVTHYYSGNDFVALAAGQTVAQLIALTGDVNSYDVDAEGAASIELEKARVTQQYSGLGLMVRAIEATVAVTLGTTLI